jgi:hypothetical protein
VSDRDQAQDATSDVEPEMAAYVESRAHVTPKARQALERPNSPMPGPGMSVEHQMPSREMNEPSLGAGKVGGDMPRPSMT